MKTKIAIFCTLGPSSLNKKFLKFTKNKVDLLRLNMSHIEVKNLSKTINFIRRHTKTPICVDTEGAQIRTKVKASKFFKIGQRFKIYNQTNLVNLYPQEVYFKLKKNDVLSIGFEDLKAKIIKKILNILL